MKRYLYNFNWLFLDKIIRIFGGLFIGIWVARYLGPEYFGILSYGIAFISFFSFMSSLGLNSIVVREVIKDELSQNRIIGAVFYLKLYGGVLAFISGCLAIYIIQVDSIVTQYVVIILLASYIFQSMDTIEYSFQAKILSRFTVIARIVAFLIANILKVYFIINEYSIIYFASAVLTEIFIGSVFLYLIYVKLNFNITLWKFNKAISLKLLKYSWPIMLSAFFITIYMKIDQVMIEHYLDMKNVGLYSVAVRLSEAWYFIPTIIVSTLMPYFIRTRDINKELYLLRLKQINTLMIWMGVFIGLIVTLFGEQIILLLFGKDYIDSHIALSLNIWAGVFVSIGIASSLWMISENLQLYQLFGTFISVILNIFGNYVLIPMYGISGAAIATLITQGLGTLVIPLLFKPIRGFIIISIVSILPIYLLKGRK